MNRICLVCDNVSIEHKTFISTCKTGFELRSFGGRIVIYIYASEIDLRSKAIWMCTLVVRMHSNWDRSAKRVVWNRSKRVWNVNTFSKWTWMDLRSIQIGRSNGLISANGPHITKEAVRKLLVIYICADRTRASKITDLPRKSGLLSI